MRVHLHNNVSSETFCENLLQIGEDKIQKDEFGKINLPQTLCSTVNNIDKLIDKVFPQIENNFKNKNWLCERAILAPLNSTVHFTNEKILELLPNESITYTSIDTLMDNEDTTLYTTEFLNSLEIPGVPSHLLKLKVGVTVILMRNLDPPRLCNGTRLLIKKLLKNLVVAEILTGCAKGEETFIPRIPIIPADLPLTFKRLQIPLKVAFSMSINKSQGQSFKLVGLDLRSQCFSHGQLYVGCSRVSSNKDLYILTENNATNNVVYKLALQ